MAFIVPIGNRRQANQQTLQLTTKPNVPSVECCCRILPKLLELSLEIICLILLNQCLPNVIHYEPKQSKNETSWITEIDQSRSYFANAALVLGMLMSLSVMIGYCLEGVHKIVQCETWMLFMCGGTSLIAGGVLLEAFINRELHNCQDRSYILACGIIQILVSILYFLDAFIASQATHPTPTVGVQEPKGSKTKHLPPPAEPSVAVVSEQPELKYEAPPPLP